jgi:hypothetical protein
MAPTAGFKLHAPSQCADDAEVVQQKPGPEYQLGDDRRALTRRITGATRPYVVQKVRSGAKRRRRWLTGWGMASLSRSI